MTATGITSILRALPLIPYRPTQWRGMIRRWGGVHQARQRPPVPLGWCVVREWDTCHWLIMPIWLYPLYITKRDWRLWMYQTLVRIGVWATDEGGYYSEGHWVWPTRRRS